jgi:hypothetical protein
MLQHVFWVSAASVPENYVDRTAPIAWLRLNSSAFPDLWMSMLRCETVLNNEALVGESQPALLFLYYFLIILPLRFRNNDRYHAPTPDQY